MGLHSEMVKRLDEYKLVPSYYMCGTCICVYAYLLLDICNSTSDNPLYILFVTNPSCVSFHEFPLF